MKKHQISAAILIFLGVFAACSGNTENAAPTPANAPTLASTVASETPGVQPTASATTKMGTAANATAASIDSTQDPIYAGLPPTTAALMTNADPAQGSELAVQKGCSACHSLEKDVKVVGPSWYNISNVAAERVAGETAVFYLYNSIIHPNQHIVETYLSGLMPQTYAEQLSEQELANLIAYLLTLKAE